MEKNLQHDEALEKFRKLVDEINVAMFITNIGGEQTTRPMATMDVDDDATLWFFTSKTSMKVDELINDNQVQLIYSHPGKDSYLDVKGSAEVIYDKALIEEKYQPIVKAWFPEGKNDPNLCLLKVIPSQAHYWDSGTSKLVEGIQILASIFTGKRLADGVEGDIVLP